MVENPEKFANNYKLKSSRLLNWNYSSSGNYFITICTYNHNHFFGKIENGKMVLSNRGRIANDELEKTIQIRENISINPWIIMPNHIHLLINIPDIHVETPRGASLQNNKKIILIPHSHKNNPDFYLRLSQKSKQEIPKIINQFKSSVKRICNNQKLYFSWQSRYYDHLVCDQKELSIIKNYIINNPQNWQKDKFYISKLKNNE